MKTTYKEIVEAIGGMSKLLDLKLKPAKAIALARLCKQLNEELQLFKEAQARIIQTSPVSAQERAATLPAFGEGKGAADLQKQFDELMAVEVEIPGEKFVLTFDEIETIDAGTVMATEPFVTIEEGTA